VDGGGVISGVNASLCALVANLPLSWSIDWAWGLPLIMFTVLVHVVGFGLISRRTLNASSRTIRRHPIVVFVVVIGLTTLVATSLHGLEAGIWAMAYRFLGALPDNRSAMLYSLNAMTSYGHINLRLDDHWHLLGAMEALNGWLLFGLSTAFLFGVIERVSSDVRRRRHDGA
jgi:MFS superfamily sulfate permease-like transporter